MAGGKHPEAPEGGAITVGIITCSDKGSRGERVDEGGRVIQEIALGAGMVVGDYVVVADEIEAIGGAIRAMADHQHLDLVVTTGGTGLSPRDVTPQATRAVVDYEVPGIAEAMRAESLKKTSAAMTSRAIAGVRGRTLIINLPGSPKGVRECLEVVLPALPHAVQVMRGSVGDHTRPS